jgi:DNA-directed RNA polymerase specialized sigma subunit
MRLDLTESLQEINQEISELHETLEFSGIAQVLLADDPSAQDYPAIKRWLEIVGNQAELERDLEELEQERDELVHALEHLEERLTGKRLA